MTLRDKCAIVGMGETEYTRHGERDRIQMSLEASLNAIADAGLSVKDIDGIVLPCLSSPTVRQISANLGIEDRISYTCNPAIGAATHCAQLQHAALAITAGIAKNVLCVVSIANFSDPVWRYSRQPAPSEGPGWTMAYRQSFEYPYGWTVASLVFAMWATRHMHVYGTTSRQLGAIAVAQRKHAQLNDKALMRRPMTIEDHQNSPMLVYPFRLLDFCLETDGAAAVVVTSATRARDLKHRPIYIMGVGEGHYYSDEIPNKPDFLGTGHHEAADRAFAMAGITRKDIDLAEIYDGFTYHVLYQLEELGFCARGEGGPYVEGGRIELGGELPVNTHGGHLSQAHVGGMNHLVEAVKQLRGDAGQAQVQDAEIALFSCEGNMGEGGVAILRR